MAKARKSKSTKNLRDLRDPLDYPETRIERYLKCIKTGDNTDLPSTVNTRIERYLYCIATGNNSTLPDHPETMIELYLDAIATGNIHDLPYDPQDRLQRYLYAAAYVDSSLLPSADYTRLEKYISSILGGTTFVTEQTPYLFRVSGGDENANVKHKELDTLVGATMAWNQLFPDDQKKTIENWTVSSINVCTTEENTKTNHIYFLNNVVSYFVPTDDVPRYRLWYNGNANNYTGPSGSIIYKATTDTEKIARVNFQSTYNGKIIEKMSFDPNAVDLTLMLGPTIADYVYSLESGTPGTGVAWLKAHGFFTKPYYAYDAGSLQSVCVSAHRMTGFNQWDEEWELGTYSIATGAASPANNMIRSKENNYIGILPSVTYYVKASATMVILFYDDSKNYISFIEKSNNTFTTPANARFMRFRMATNYGTTYNHDICINLSQPDTSVSPHNGEYLPYTLHTYALDHSVTRRGIYKLDANNKLYADGDTDDGKGTLTRKYGIVDLGTLVWYKAGSTFYAKLSTHKTMADDEPINAISTDGRIFLQMSGSSNTEYIKTYDSTVESTAAFEALMSGVYLVYELATPTTETVEPFTNPQQVDKAGTEEYVDFPYSVEDRDVEVPVGHITQYPQ